MTWSEQTDAPGERGPLPPPSRRKLPRRPVWPWIVASLVAVACLVTCGLAVAVALVGSASSEIDKQIQTGSEEKRRDVTITTCRPSDLGIEIEYKVVNSSGRVASYLIAFEVRNAADVRLSEAYGSVNSLGSGATATGSTLAVISGSTDGTTCVVTRVD